MKRTVAITMLGVLLAAALPAWAQQGSGAQGRRGMERPPTQQPMPPADRGGQARKGDDQGGARRGQLSPEERQQLRRDISDHGRDIYRDPRGNSRRP